MRKVGVIFRETLASHLKDDIQNNNNVFIIHFDKISGDKITSIRKDFNKAGARMSVVKNSIARIALKELEFESLSEKVERQIAFVSSDKDSAEISKLVVKYEKEIENIQVAGGVLDGRVLSEADVKRLAELPSREVLLSMLLSTIQSPLTRLANALVAKHRDLLSVLKQLSEKKGGN